jgi:xyloglucan:xyloglucosyl transferase
VCVLRWHPLRVSLGCVYAGSGFVSQDLYLHGYFSASIKLPADYTAGVVVAFYVSNSTVHIKNFNVFLNK